MPRGRDTETSEMRGRQPNSSIDFNDTTDEINIDEFLIDNFIHDSRGKKIVKLRSRSQVRSRSDPRSGPNSGPEGPRYQD